MHLYKFVIHLLASKSCAERNIDTSRCNKSICIICEMRASRISATVAIMEGPGLRGQMIHLSHLEEVEEVGDAPLSCRLGSCCQGI